MTGRMEGKAVIVTGSAQGIGRGIITRLAEEGAQVVVADLNGEKAAAVADEINAKGGKAISVAVDVTDRAQVKAVIDKCVESYGKLDVMFNNAGFNQPMKFMETTEENFMQVFRVNTMGCLIGIQEAAKQMIKQGHGGKIVCTASISSYSADYDFISYGVSKFGVHALIQGAAKLLTPEYGITVTGFGPGVVDTPLWDQLDEELMNMGNAEEKGQAMREFSANILQRKPASPDDIAGTALFLASSDSDYMTGQIIMIDGGMVFV